MNYFFSFFCVLFIVSCSNTSKKNKSKLPFLPNEASIIFKVNDLEKVRSLLKNNSLLQQNKNNGLYSYFNSLEPFKTVKFSDLELYITFSPLGKNDFGISLILDADKASAIDFTSYYLTDRTYNNFLYKEYKINNTSLFGAQLNRSWVFSDDYLLIENHIKQFENSIPYKHTEAFQSLTNESVSLVLINSELEDISNRLFPNLLDELKLQKKATGWIAGDFNIEKNSLSYNAIYRPEGAKDITSIFENLTPQSNQMAEVTPYNAQSFSSITFDDYETLSQNLLIFNNKKRTAKATKIDELLAEVVEFGTIKLSKSNLFACRIPDENIEVSTYLDFEKKASLYRGISIFKLDNTIDFGALLEPLITNQQVTYFIHFNEFLLFSDSIEHIKKIIPFLKSNNTLSYKNWYQTFTNQLTAESSLLSVFDTEYANHQLENTLSSSLQKKWGKTTFKDYKVAAIQMVNEENFSHLHLTASKNIDKQKDFVVNETENVILSSNLLSNPQFVTNYINKTKDIAVQDGENNLNILTNKGELKWSKQIESPILGTIQQIDIYRNGRLQYLFNTATKLYVVDRNGKDVAPFPLIFDIPLTQPVALFDYDNNRKYRMLLTQNSILTMYDSNGKKVSGFKFKNKLNGTITHPPKHVRVGKKDYIVVNESNGGVHFLNRTGKTRLKPNKTPKQTSQEWFWYANAFCTLNENNTITQVKTDNTVSYLPSKLKLKNAIATATAKTWVSFIENTLSIKNNIVELEYGRYTAPNIYLVNNKIYVTITNMDTKKVYLFDSNAKPIKGFPVFGTGEAAIENADKDANLELIVKGDENSILFYEFR